MRKKMGRGRQPVRDVLLVKLPLPVAEAPSFWGILRAGGTWLVSFHRDAAKPGGICPPASIYQWLKHLQLILPVGPVAQSSQEAAFGVGR